jgi:hypothetical protein
MLCRSIAYRAAQHGLAEYWLLHPEPVASCKSSEVK